MPRPITLESIDRLPAGDLYEIPDDEVFVRLGCVGCSHGVCFKAVGVTDISPKYSANPQETQDFIDIIGTVESKQVAGKGYASGYNGHCGDSCLEAANIQTAVELLDDVFGSHLASPA